MADNYVDIPILVLKLLAADTVSPGDLLQGESTSGYALIETDTYLVGMMAMETVSTAGTYFDAMVIGTAYFKLADTIKAGSPLKYSAKDTFALADAARGTRAVLLDYCADSALKATRKYRALLYGAGTSDSLWPA
jgi:hypothetical protein